MKSVAIGRFSSFFVRRLSVRRHCKTSFLTNGRLSERVAAVIVAHSGSAAGLLGPTLAKWHNLE